MDKKYELEKWPNYRTYIWVKNGVIYNKQKDSKKINDTCVIELTEENVPYVTRKHEGEDIKYFLLNFIEIGDTYNETDGFKKTIHSGDTEEEKPLFEFFKDYYYKILLDTIIDNNGENLKMNYIEFMSMVKSHDKTLNGLLSDADEDEKLNGVEPIEFNKEIFEELKKTSVINSFKKDIDEKLKIYGFKLTNLNIEIE